MSSLNQITLLGRVGREVEIRYLPSGDPVANFSMATTETWRDKGGSKKEETTWHQIEVFGKMAEIARDYVVKGRELLVQGALKIDEWTDKDGVKRTKAKIKVSGPGGRLVLLGSRDAGKPRNEHEEAGHGADALADDEGSVPF